MLSFRLQHEIKHNTIMEWVPPLNMLVASPFGGEYLTIVQAPTIRLTLVTRETDIIREIEDWRDSGYLENVGEYHVLVPVSMHIHDLGDSWHYPKCTVVMASRMGPMETPKKPDHILPPELFEL